MNARLVLALTAFGVAAAVATPSQAEQARSARYTGGGTVVVKQSDRPATADEGVLVCSPSRGQGVGGGCVDFGIDPRASSVQVIDDLSGREVAFQVCIDNNGDGACVSPDEGPCADLIFFSHDDRGSFFNPLGPLPTGFKSGCPGGPWRGYVVFLCEGVHTAADGTPGGGGAHQHPATQGFITTVDKPGSGFGTFCGGSRSDPSDKRYVVAG